MGHCSTFTISPIATRAPRVGSDPPVANVWASTLQFQPALPVWGATSAGRTVGGLPRISTRAPRVGSDRGNPQGHRKPGNFNPRSPCGERLAVMPVPFSHFVFQPALPVWGATRERGTEMATMKFQPALPVWGATSMYPLVSSCGLFQPALPVWGATRAARCLARCTTISTRAPRVGSDLDAVRGVVHGVISTRAPRVGSDVGTAVLSSVVKNFNPRSPCGERRRFVNGHVDMVVFQPALPVWGATTNSNNTANTDLQFQPALPVWGATTCLF